MVSYVQFSRSIHIVDSLRDKPYSFSEWLRLMRTRYGNVTEMKHNEPVSFKVCPELEGALQEIWDNIRKITFEEAILESDSDKKRIAFSAIGPNSVLGSPKAKKRLVSKFSRSDKQGDTYHLYDIVPASVGLERVTRSIRALQYNCPSTNHVYWSYVPTNINKAEEAVAWMCITRIAPNDLLEIKRQGEVYIFKYKPGAKKLEEHRHLTAKEYWDKIQEQT